MLHELNMMAMSRESAPADRHKCHSRKPIKNAVYGVSGSTHEPYMQECAHDAEADIKCEGCPWRAIKGQAPLPVML